MQELNKSIREQISSYNKKTNDSDSTLQQENQIKNTLTKYKELLNNLQNAYSTKNIPGGMPQKTIDARQKEIQQFAIDYDELEKSYKETENEKYRFKNLITEDYSKKEEYKNMSAGELMTLQKKKLDNQDERLDEITLDVKKGTQLAKNAGHVMKEQNKQLDQINEDIDRTKERMDTLTGRFERYVAKFSMCKMIIIIVVELAIAGGAAAILL
jgi:chromosome segregation ATPase